MQLLTEAHFLSFIRGKSSENEHLAIKLVLNATTISSKQVAKILWKLFVGRKIELVRKRHDMDELYLMERRLKKDQNDPDLIDELITGVLLCSRLLNIKKVSEFNQFTEHRFEGLVLLQFLGAASPEFIHLKIICKHLSAFFAGESHLSIIDLGLQKAELIEMSEKLNENTFIPQAQQLIGISKEKGGYYLDGVVKPRLLRLLKNELVPLLVSSPQKKHGLYELIKWKEMEACKLYYNKQEQMLFDNISKILNAVKPELNHSLSLLLHGVSGTGKTEFVYQLARAVQADVMQLNFSEIQSKWIGETEKNIREVFDTYQAKRAESSIPLLLLINEADGLMNRRVSVNVGNDAFHNQAQTQFLEILEHFKGTVIATTNLHQNLDEAFHRRFLFQQEINLPDRDTRELILKNSIFFNLLSEDLYCSLIDAVWSAAQLKNIERKIEQLKNIQKIDKALLEWLLFQDGILLRKRTIGFRHKNNFKNLSQKPEEDTYCHKTN